jgi:hypothetical protein
MITQICCNEYEMRALLYYLQDLKALSSKMDLFYRERGRRFSENFTPAHHPARAL